jgi:hypothetical protein
MTVIICGDRYYTNYQKILKFVQSLPKGTIILEGGCKGADELARKAAGKCGLDCRTYFAEWHIYGKGAGPMRNAKMLVEGKPDVVVAFHDNLMTSKGTKDMLERSRNAGVNTLLNPRTWYKS